MSYGRDRTVLPVRIANGATESDEITINGLRIAGIQMPAAWTAGNLTVKALTRQTSAATPVKTFGNVVDGAGAAVVLAATPTADTYLPVADTSVFYALGTIKLVAGAAQGAERNFFLVLVGE